MNSNSYVKFLKVRPKWYISSSYVFLDVNNNLVATIFYPLLARVFNVNRALLFYKGKQYLIQDAVAVTTMIGKQRFANTFLKSGDSDILKLTYKIVGSQEEYAVTDLELGTSYQIKLTGFGIWDIFKGSDKVATLKNRDLFLRRSRIELNSQVPDLVLFLIFWGSVNNQDVRR